MFCNFAFLKQNIFWGQLNRQLNLNIEFILKKLNACYNSLRQNYQVLFSHNKYYLDLTAGSFLGECGPAGSLCRETSWWPCPPTLTSSPPPPSAGWCGGRPSPGWPPPWWWLESSRHRQCRGRWRQPGLIILHLVWEYGGTHLVITDNVPPDVTPELLLGEKQDDGVDHELRVDEHITDHDEEGREEPAVESHHQHCGDVETKGQQLDGC